MENVCECGMHVPGPVDRRQRYLQTTANEICHHPGRVGGIVQTMNCNECAAAHFRTLLRDPLRNAPMARREFGVASSRPIRLPIVLAFLAASACVASHEPRSAVWEQDNADCNALSLNAVPAPDALSAPFRSKAGDKSVGASAGAMIASGVSRKRNYLSCMRQRGHES